MKRSKLLAATTALSLSLFVSACAEGPEETPPIDDDLVDPTPGGKSDTGYLSDLAAELDCIFSGELHIDVRDKSQAEREAALDAQPVGFCLGRLAADEAEVLSVAVLADWHRQGVGDRLMQAFHARLQSDGGKSVFLEVAQDNVAAIGLYRALGYAEVGRRRGYYAATVGTPARDALVMRLQFADLANSGPDAMLKRKL